MNKELSEFNEKFDFNKSDNGQTFIVKIKALKTMVNKLVKQLLNIGSNNPGQNHVGIFAREFIETVINTIFDVHSNSVLN